MNASSPAPRGRVLIVAGSDSGGGAGVQADIKTITSLGGYAASAVTALTVQNTLGVFAVTPSQPALVIAQMRVVLEDIGADVIKTGMMGDTRLVEAVAEYVTDSAPRIPRIVDPVMVATSGDRLLPESAVDAVRRLLVPGAALVTPNAPEAEILTGRPVDTLDGQRRAADRLLEAGALAALVKGGHVEGEVIFDVLHDHHSETILETPRQATRATHGTGCTLASGIAAGLARGMSLSDAVARSHAFLQEAIRRAPGFGAGRGPVDHAWPARDPEAYSRLMRRWPVPAS
jgi:hydroxymethylpyrimidine/phosphomethylpyrimidine kinase